MLEIVQYPHPALRYSSRSVTEIDDNLRATIRAMFDLMYAANGIGLAANQVALPYRLFVTNVTGDPAVTEAERIFINPEILRRKGSAEEEEGCLSLPQLYGQVRRSEKILVDAFDLDGEEFELALDELEARVVQHENDHIDGVLFIDRMTEAARRELESRLADFESHFLRQQESGLVPPDDEIQRTLRSLEPAPVPAG